MLKGIDCSAYQGVIEWPRVVEALNLRFAIVKTAEGMNGTPDVKAAYNVIAAKDAGLVVGGYFFLRPRTSVKPEAQAKLHFELAQECGLNKAGDLPPAADLEDPPIGSWSNVGFTPASLRGWTLDYLQALGSLWGMTPLLYSYESFFMQLGVGGEPAFSSYPLWSASYTSPGWPVDGQRPMILRPWTSWCMWQWDGGKTVRLPGGGSVDADVFWGSETDLQAILQKPDLTVATTDPASSPTDLKG